MTTEDETRNRQAKLDAIRPRKARPEERPKGVSTIRLDEMNALGVDASRTLYWFGKSIAVRRIKLRRLELF